MVRLSRESDKEDIIKLVESSFGDSEDKGIYDNLDGRYFVKEVDNRIVAMSGLDYSDTYQALEVDWTCTLPEYRNKHYMHEIFAEMLLDIKENVYCSCWRLPDKDKINLYGVVTAFGFIEVVKSAKLWKVPFNCHRNGVDACRNYKCVGCFCYEDLWLRPYSDGKGHNKF